MTRPVWPPVRRSGAPASGPRQEGGAERGHSDAGDVVARRSQQRLWQVSRPEFESSEGRGYLIAGLV